MEKYSPIADLSVGFYDLSSTSALGNTPLIYCERTLQTYLTQLETRKNRGEDIKGLSSDINLSQYGHDFMLGFQFDTQKIINVTKNEDGTDKTTIRVMTSRPDSRHADNRLPSEKQYGSVGMPSYPVLCNRIASIRVFPVTLPSVGNRHIIDSSNISQNGLLEKIRHTKNESKMPDTHPSHYEYRQTYFDHGYRVTKLSSPKAYNSTDEYGATTQNTQPYKGMGYERSRKTKSKISSGGRCKAPEYLPDSVAFQSRRYQYGKGSKNTVVFTVTNGRNIVYRIDNQPSQIIGHIVLIDGQITPVIKPGYQFTSDTYELWERCQQWFLVAYLSFDLIPYSESLYQQEVERSNSLTNRSKLAKMACRAKLAR